MSQELFIEPCCYQRQLSQIIAGLEDAGSGRTAATFFSSGDWDLSTLLTFMAGQVPESVITLALCTVDQKTLCACLLYTSPSPRDFVLSRMPSSA